MRNVCLSVALTVVLWLHVTAVRRQESSRPTIPNSLSPKIPEGWYDCFEDKCRCKGTVADCSHNFGHLNFVPQLPTGITTLDFSWNTLTRITDSFFLNVTKISSLDLSHNRVATLSPGAFKEFENLTCLLFNQNNVIFIQNIQPVFSIGTLKRLEVENAVFDGNPDPSHLLLLEILNINGNYFYGAIDLTYFKGLKRIQELFLQGTDVSPKTSVALKVKKLDLGNNGYVDFPQTCQRSTSLFPDLQYLSLHDNSIGSIPNDVCLPQLKFLDLSQNSFAELLMNSFNSHKFPSLLKLHLDASEYGETLSQIEGFAFNNSALRLLSLSNNNIPMGSKAVDTDAFRGCWNLTTIEMSNNDFSAVMGEKLQQLFSATPNLNRLDLTTCRISNITNETFVGVPLLHTLILGDNSLTHIPDGAFDALTYLKDLELDDSGISLISEATFSWKVRQTLEHIDLSGNKFTCDCELRWFGQWLETSPSLFNNSRGTYTCHDDRFYGIKITSFHLSDQACMFAKKVYAYLLLVSLLMLLILVVTLMCAGWQVEFRVRPFLRHVFRIRRERQQLENGQFDYDVFVCYADGDDDWVQEWLRPELEGRRGLKLCLHQRDFHPGRSILDNIEECLEGSKKVLMVFSTHFALSRWCQFELSLGHRHTMDRGDQLLIVYLHDVAPRDLTAGMAALLRTCTYLPWPQRREQCAFFWNRVFQVLQDNTIEV